MTTLTVGTGQQYTTIAAAVAATKDGDTVLVQAGTYTNDFFDVQTKITLQSVGGLAIIAATVSPSNGKGAVVVDNDVTIDGFGFTGVGVGDGNGAGIRYDSGKMVVRNSVFWNNQNGILANADPNGTILIQNSEFSHNGAGDGYTHNIYINAVASLTVQNSYFHDSVAGHEIKSRALSTTITGNRIQDLAGDGSYSIDLPDGGLATVTGNTIEKGPNTQNNFTIHYGGEGAPYAGSALTVSGNTLISDNPAATLLLNQTTIPVALTNNALWGFSATQIANGPVVQSGNTTLATEPALNLATLVPATLTTTTTGGVTTTTPITTTPAPPPTTDLSLGTKLTSFGTAGAVVASGHVLTVGGFGTGAAFSSLQSALAASQDGDTIQLAAGTYVNDFGVVNHKVIIEGVGGIARMVQQNDIYHASGILVVNTDVTIMNMEFTGTASDNGYAPGVAINAGNATIVNSRFDNNEVGLRANDNPLTNLSIYNSDIGSNGNVYRGTNNLQVGAINSLTMVGDYVHGATSGHEVYDRAFNTDIENTRINDGAGYASSFLVDLGAGGNAVLNNDSLVKGANTENGVLVHVGGEVTPYLNSNVQITRSTLVTQYVNAGHPYTYFIAAETSTGTVPVTATADTFVGGVPGSAQLINATGTGNVAIPSTAPGVPAGIIVDTSSPLSAAATPPLFPAAAGADTLALTLAEDAGDVNAEFLVSLDGTPLGGGMITAAAGGAGQVFDFSGSWGAGPHSLAISLLNPYISTDGGAYDAIVQGVQLDGASVAPARTIAATDVYSVTLSTTGVVTTRIPVIATPVEGSTSTTVPATLVSASTAPASTVSAPAPAPADPAPPTPAGPVADWTDVTTGTSGHASLRAPDAGGPDYLQAEYIWSGPDNVAMATATPNVFLKSGSGDDALTVTSGQNVLDGGAGSNFLVGGSGNDTFFVDARSNASVWSTVVGFHAGDMATLWGFVPGTSSYRWDPAISGAAGYQGATLRGDVSGQGSAASFTFAGMSVAQAQHLQVTSGTAGGQPYLLIYNPGV